MAELTDAQIKLAAKVGADAFKESVKQAKKSAYEKKFENTKLILETYHFLEDHVETGLPELNPDDLSKVSALSPSELSVYSIMGFKARSWLMIKYIDDTLDQYKRSCASSVSEKVHRRYPIISCLYLIKKPITREKCAERFNVDHRTIDRDVKAAVEDLSFLLWGADAINALSMMS